MPTRKPPFPLRQGWSRGGAGRSSKCAETIYAGTRRAELAVADGREALKLVDAEDNPLGVASMQAKLAEFLLADGKIGEAAELAQRACDELMPRKHVEAAGALVTLALIRNDESSAGFIEEALRLERESPLSQAGSKARALAELQRRAAGLQVEAQH